MRSQRATPRMTRVSVACSLPEIDIPGPYFSGRMSHFQNVSPPYDGGIFDSMVKLKAEIGRNGAF
jgi:hypothetical protein